MNYHYLHHQLHKFYHPTQLRQIGWSCQKEEKPLFGTTTQSASIVLDDKTYVIGDAGNGNSCKVNQSRYVGIYWCAGNLSVNLSTNTISCDGSTLGNEAQTDSMSVDVSIRAMPSKENPKFLC